MLNYCLACLKTLGKGNLAEILQMPRFRSWFGSSGRKQEAAQRQEMRNHRI